MRLSTRASAGRCVGIDLGTARIKLCGPRGERLSLTRIDREALISEAEATRLARVLERRGWRGHPVRLIAPQGIVRAAELSLPPRSSGAPVDEIARQECRRLFGLDGGFELSLVPLPAGRETGVEPALAIACGHDAAEGVLAPLERAGIEVTAFEPAVTALSRAAGSGAVLTLDLGAGSSMIVTSVDGEARYQRELPDLTGPLLGLDRPVTNAARREALRERFADELDRTVRYLAQRFSFSPSRSLRLIGGYAECAEPVVGEATSELGWSVSIDAGEYALAAAAALDAAPDAPMLADPVREVAA
ncbi:MAG: hypothetical protein AAGG07_01450 [Planctomycetota bacterium]